MEGTLRTLSEPVRTLLHDEIRRVCRHTALAYGCSAAVEIEPGYPVTVNDEAAARRVSEVAGAVLGRNRVAAMPAPIMGAEDFSYVLRRCPVRWRSSVRARRGWTRRRPRRTTATGWCSTSRPCPRARRCTRRWRWTRCGGSPSRPGITRNALVLHTNGGGTCWMEESPLSAPSSPCSWSRWGSPGSSGGADGRGTSGRSCRSASPALATAVMVAVLVGALKWSPDADVGMFVGVGMLAGAVGVLVTSAAIVALLPDGPSGDPASDGRGSPTRRWPGCSASARSHSPWSSSSCTCSWSCSS